MPGKVNKYITLSKYFFYCSFLIINFSLLIGCGIFDTREPENPVTIRSTFVPPTSPELVLENLSFSIQEKNSVNYNKCITDELYIYVPDTKSLQNYREIFMNWSKNSERRYIDNLIAATNPTATSVLFLDNDNMLLINSDSAIYTAEYIVVFQHIKTNIPKSAKGNLTMYISSDDNNLFSIKRWEDFRQNDDDFTWSEFRANFNY